jgi:aarF domain-containing kinase
VQIEGNFATLVVGTVVLEGLGRQLDPQLNLLEAAVPFLFQHRKQVQALQERPASNASAAWVFIMKKIRDWLDKHVRNN